MLDKIKHFADTVVEFLSSYYGWFTMLFTVLITSDTTMLLSFFVSTLVADYFTGIWASYVEYKKSGKIAEVYVTESERLRESGTKVMGYLIIIVLSWFISKYIYLDTVKLFGVIRDFSVFQIAIIMCIGIEFWSNLENLKRAGFDIVGKFENITKNIWKLVRSAQGR